MHPHIQNAVEQVRQRRDSLYKKIFKEDYGAKRKLSKALIDESVIEDKNNTDPNVVFGNKNPEEEYQKLILRIHEEKLHRQKYYLII